MSVEDKLLCLFGFILVIPFLVELFIKLASVSVLLRNIFED